MIFKSEIFDKLQFLLKLINSTIIIFTVLYTLMVILIKPF